MKVSSNRFMPAFSLVAHRAAVFIDPAIENYQSLIAHVAADAAVMLLDPQQDAIAQITRYITTERTITSLHLVAHGTPGSLQLGHTTLSLSTIDQYADLLQQWSHIRSVLLYGCRVAVGDAGTELMERLHRYTGAHIAASRQPIGHAALGGHWQLEVQTGPVEAIAFRPSVQTQFQGTLESKDPNSIELVGARINPGDTDGPRLATWFTYNGLGVEGGPSGTYNASSGFGLIGLGGYGYTGPIDAGNVLFINNQVFAAPGSTVDLDSDKNIVTTGVASLSGLNVQAQVYADRNHPVLRSYYTFQNPTNQDITIPVSWVSNFKGIGENTIQTTSSGDKALTLDDRWLITDDAPGGSAVALAYVLNGAGNPTVTPSAISQSVFQFDKGGKDGFRADYVITIPAKSTRALLFFNVSGTNPDKILQSNLPPVDQSPNGNSLFDGLSQEQLQQVLNWSFGAGIVATPKVGQTTEAGGTATFQIKLSQKPTANVTVNFSSSDATEGIPVNSKLTFTPDNWNTNQTLTVKGVNDAIDDGNVTYKILANFTSTDAAYGNDLPGSITLTNLDNDGRVEPPSRPPQPKPPGGKVTVIKGNARDNNLTGTSGNDEILGFNGDDKLLGGPGNDTLNGGKGDDKLYGGKGNDVLYAGGGKDSATGNEGRDTFALSKGQGYITIKDFDNGEDRLGLTGNLTFKSLKISRDGDDTIIQRSKNDTLAILTNINPNQITASDFVTL